MVESETLPPRPSPLPEAEGSDCACAIWVRRHGLTTGPAALSRGMCALRAHFSTSPRRGEVKGRSLNVIGRKSSAFRRVDPALRPRSCNTKYRARLLQSSVGAFDVRIV